MIHLKPSLVHGLRSDSEDPRQAIADALQHAIELEHATIPTYLYALYSLVPGKNDDVAEIIESVVVEEMLHMVLACNILNAIGGTPVIDRPPQDGQPGFIPTYPGPLPGGVEDQLTVHLRPFSMAQLETFLEIEAPEEDIHVEETADAERPVTIGMFYRAISQRIADVGQELFDQSRGNQIGPDLMRESVVVHSVDTAQAAITVIVDQGEGTSNSPEEVFGPDVAHYYRFEEIKWGHRMVRDPVRGTYSYTGAPVTFDPTGVYPVPDDPAQQEYSGSRAFANDTFNYTYTSLLKALHDLVNGANTTAQFARTLGLMMSLKGQAIAMAAGLPNPDPQKSDVVGPSFQYQPLNPGPGEPGAA